MLGALAGDIIGSIYEFNNIHTTDFPLFSEKSTFTDDSIMTMAVAEWLLSDPKHKHSSLIKIMEDYYEQFPYPMGGYGANFNTWLKKPTAQKLPYNSFGNGSAMRCSACGYVAHSREEAMELAKISAEITHNHPEGIKGAQAVAGGIYMLRHGALKSDVAEWMTSTFGYNLSHDYKYYLEHNVFDESCQGTIPVAWAAFAYSAGFENTIKHAVSLGGDSDTIACIAGAFCEAFEKSIPHDCMFELRERLPKEWWSIIWRVKAYEVHRVASDNIQYLKSEEVFVFGSNKDGKHCGGAARYAYEHWGAEWGVGEGITGKCYAIPSMEGIRELDKAVSRFTEWAEKDENHNFLVTAVGCGIAGYTPEEIAPMFSYAAMLPNVYLPQCFWDVLDEHIKVYEGSC